MKTLTKKRILTATIAAAEYTAIILGTVYALQWAENIAKVSVWVSAIVNPTMMCVVIFALSINRLVKENKADMGEIIEAIQPSAFANVHLTLEICSIVLMAAYGWTWTAGFALVSVFATWILKSAARGAVNGVYKERVGV